MKTVDQKRENSKRSETKKLDLPFMKRHEDWASWAYDHRLGLMTTVLVFLLVAGAFASVRIYLKETDPFNGMIIELPPDQRMPEQEELEKMKLQQQYTSDDFSDVRNVKVNQDQSLDAGLKDAKNSNAQDIYKEAQAVQSRMNANREAYEAGLRDEATRAANQRDPKKGTEQQFEKESKTKGKVTVSYYLKGRRATYLHVPAYTCRGGGEVEVNITVNQRGEVVNASINRSASTSDDCLTEMAVKAAYASRFNVDGSADNKQSGTISYIFIPQ